MGTDVEREEVAEHVSARPYSPRVSVHQAESPNSQFGVDAPAGFSDDLKGVIQSLRRRAWLFFAVLLPVVGLAATYVYFATPLFSATATVVIDPRRQFVTSSPEVLPDVAPDSEVIDTQVQLIESRVVLGKAVDFLTSSHVELGVEQKKHFPFSLFSDNTAVDADAQPTRDELIDLLELNLAVDRVGLTSALQVTYTDEDPQSSSQVANAIANQYIAYLTDVKLQANRDANQWLKVRVAELKSQLEAAEAAVDAYRSRSGLLLAKGSTSTESQLTNVDLGLNEARQALSDAEARLATFSTALRLSGAAEAAKVVPSAAMQTLRAQYVALLSQKALLSPTFGPQHPQMIELNRQLDSVQEQMNAEAHRTVAELTSDVRIAENKVAGLTSIREQSRKQLSTDNAANVELTQLQSNADSIRQLYEGMLARLQQTTAQETLGQVNAAVVSEATVPADPSSPKKKVFLAAGSAVGLALGAFAVLLAQLFDGAILRPKDFERRTHVPVLSLVPRLRSRDLRVDGKRVPVAEIILDKPMSLFAESFRNLRVGIAQAAGARQSLIVQITSGSFGEGKTVSSIAFAQTAAMDGRRVLLIDADVRRRSLTQYMGITAEAGLMEVLRGKAELRDVIVYGGAKQRPHVLPLSTADAGPHDRFSGRTFEALLQKLKTGFDLIVIDSAPVLAVAESLALTRRVDAVVLVARWNKTPIDVVLKALEEIDRVGGRIAGTLLTQVDMKKVIAQSYGRSHYPALMKYYQR